MSYSILSCFRARRQMNGRTDLIPHNRRAVKNGARSLQMRPSNVCPKRSLHGLHARMVVLPPRICGKMWSSESRQVVWPPGGIEGIGQYGHISTALEYRRRLRLSGIRNTEWYQRVAAHFFFSQRRVLNATHLLLDTGAHIRFVSSGSGHAYIQNTVKYTHLRSAATAEKAPAFSRDAEVLEHSEGSSRASVGRRPFFNIAFADLHGGVGAPGIDPHGEFRTSLLDVIPRCPSRMT